MPQIASRTPVDAEIAKLAGLMLARTDELTDLVLNRVAEEFPLYIGMIAPDALHVTIKDHIHFAFEPITRYMPPDARPAATSGRDRAMEGIPLTVIMDGYRIAFGVLWKELAGTADSVGLSTQAALRAASEVMDTLDAFTRESSAAYKEELRYQARREEQQRAALVQALLEGRLDDTNVWEAAELLRLPTVGPYVVIAARVPNAGEYGLPHIERELGGMGIDSAWRLMHDVEVGVAHLARPGDQFDKMVAALAAEGTGRVGVSPPYEHLLSTCQAMRLARIAMRGAQERRTVVVFGRDLLSAAAASAPDIMPRVADAVLGGLDGLAEEDRTLLLHTFGAWLDADGSAAEAAKLLFVHPNTVRYRLRRLEERTGRSLSNPRAVAELSLAYEIDSALVAEAGSGG
ncbi:sugar diacid utilization regulator [Catenulispora sp. GP43]|uniref:PucR family transcriptional regulator n=1 Tax=Catenulispora sp. GP43 TaxID=3156263 RepID=UPI0035133E24